MILSPRVEFMELFSFVYYIMCDTRDDTRISLILSIHCDNIDTTTTGDLGYNMVQHRFFLLLFILNILFFIGVESKLQMHCIHQERAFSME